MDFLGRPLLTCGISLSQFQIAAELCLQHAFERANPAQTIVVFFLNQTKTSQTKMPCRPLEGRVVRRVWTHGCEARVHASARRADGGPKPGAVGALQLQGEARGSGEGFAAASGPVGAGGVGLRRL